jgi:hypothetical protein
MFLLVIFHAVIYGCCLATCVPVVWFEMNDHIYSINLNLRAHCQGDNKKGEKYPLDPLCVQEVQISFFMQTSKDSSL